MTLTKRAFVAWLREQKPGRRFRRGSTCACPIAEWITETLDPGARVFQSYWELSAGFARRLPWWAQRFIRDVDMGNKAETITAAECLALLGENP